MKIPLRNGPPVLETPAACPTNAPASENWVARNYAIRHMVVIFIRVSRRCQAGDRKKFRWHVAGPRSMSRFRGNRTMSLTSPSRGNC